MTTGERGETIAAEYLSRHGYRVLRKNYHTRYGEIDLICEDAKYLVFVEVKSRRNTKFGAPCEAVTNAKQQKIIRSAQKWLMEHPTPLQPRFDVVEVLVSGISCRVNHIPNAFEVYE